MARKRRRDLEDYIDSDNDDPIEDSLSETGEGALHSSDDDYVESDDEDTSSGYDSGSNAFKMELYKEKLRYYKKIKGLKRKFKMSLSHEREKHEPVKKSKETFTRFSVTLFSSVIDALTPEDKKVIESYGFGSLLEFNKCYVPIKFAKWVAHVVDYKSGDIVVDGKIISLTKESVHNVLDIPMGGRPFPRDIISGKSFVLEKFQKQSIPSVTYFANKLIKREEALSDEDIFICFILVALNTFLCPNSSLVPSQKHFGIFDDIQNTKEFDWSGYVLSWLLDHIKTFRKCKSSKRKGDGTLGGCLYYLAVMYLDFVDFGTRRVPDSLPRISIWKDNMIKTYSDLDLKSPGCYGFRPILDYSDTCYSKRFHLFDSSTSSLVHDVDFMDKLDFVSRCKLPDVMKSSICKVIENHSFNSGLSLNLDVNAISSLPENLLNPFAKLLQHASRIDSSSKELVLDVLKVITEYSDDNADKSHELNSSKYTSGNQSEKYSENHASDINNLTAFGRPPDGDYIEPFPVHHSTRRKSTSSLRKPPSDVHESSHIQSRKTFEQFSPNILIASSTICSAEFNQKHTDLVIQKLTKNSNSPATPINKAQGFVSPPSGYPPADTATPTQATTAPIPQLEEKTYCDAPESSHIQSRKAFEQFSSNILIPSSKIRSAEFVRNHINLVTQKLTKNSMSFIFVNF